MRFPLRAQHLRRAIRIPARIVATLALLPLLLLLGRSALAQTGSGSLTLVKEADPADGTNFTLAPTLTPLGSFGSSGSISGRFSNPEGIAVGQNGALYVSDSGNARVQQFDSAGNFVRTWGWGVDTNAAAFEVCTVTCQAGITGNGSGQFDNHQGIATAPDPGGVDIVYVVDSGNNRIQQFEVDDSGVDFVRAWGWGVEDGTAAFQVCTDPGPCQAGISGGGAGQFDNPTGVAVGPDGSVYVAEFGNHRVQQFEADGDFVRAWGRGVATGAAAFEICTDPGPCQAGDNGDGAGEFNVANGVAVGPDGSVYVTDLSNDRIQQFEADGDFVRAWGWDVIPGTPSTFEICTAPGPCQTGDFGNGVGQFDLAYYVAAAPDGSVYVGDYNNDRIQQFTATGSFVRAWGWNVIPGGGTGFEACTGPCQFGSSGGGLGQFNGPNGVAIGQDGTLYVTDYNNQRVQRFLVGNFLLDDAPIDDNDAYTDTVVIAGLPDDDYAFAEISPADWTLGDVNCTGGTLVHSGRAFTVTLSGSVQITCTLTNIPVTQTLTVDKVVVGGGPLDADDFDLYIDDVEVTRGVATLLVTGTHTVTETSDPQYTASFGGDCDAEGIATLSLGAHITCTVTNTYIIPTLTLVKEAVPADGTNFTLAPTLTPLGIIGSNGNAAGQFRSPSGIAVGQDGALYVNDRLNARVQQFDSAGTFVHAWGYGVATGVEQFEVCTSSCLSGFEGDGAGQFDDNEGIATVPGPGGVDIVYVADSSNDRIQQFEVDESGVVFVRAWGWGVADGTAEFQVCTAPGPCQEGITGGGAGQLNGPSGVAVGPDGSVYVGEYANERVQQFEADGDFVRAWGWGVEDGTAEFQVCTGPCQAGSSGGGAGQFRQAEGVAVGPDGSVYVVDNINSRIQQFEADGDFVRTWGRNVIPGAPTGFEICTGPCQGGFFGGAAGEFNTPYYVAVAPDGSVYVGDSFNHRIQQFTATGTFVRAWGKGVATGANAFEVCTDPCQAGSNGILLGYMDAPYGVAIGQDGTLYVAEGHGDRVQRFLVGNFLLDDAPIDDNDAYTDTVVIAGLPDDSYAFAEISPADWMLDDVNCTGGTLVHSGRAFTVTLSGSAQITCTLTNIPVTQTLTVDKVVMGDGPLDADDFTLFIDGGEVSRGVANLLAAGAYTVTETDVPSYTASFSGDCDAEGIATLAIGAHITCTITNTYITQTLTVNKVVTGGGPLDADDFELLIDDVEVTRGVANLRAAGTYAVSETYVPSYSPSFSGDCDAEGIATLSIGAHITCTVTNTYITQTLTVDKVVVGGGPLDADDFTLFIDDVEVTRGAANLRPAGPYTVTEESDPQYTASFGGDCDAEGVATLAIGAHITCTVTNTYITQTLTVDKVVVGGGPLDADDFTLFIDDVEVTRGAANLRPAGTYTVTEESDPQYTASFGGDCDAEGIATLAIGAHITCTVTNTYITQTLTIDKVVEGGGPLDADDFTLFIDDVEVTRGAANLRPAGPYTVTEESDPQYTASFGGDCDAEGVATLAIGAHITCTITNTYITQTLTVDKVVIGGGPLDADDFTLFIDGGEVSRGVANLLAAGAYTVTETDVPSYAPSFSGDCDAEGIATLAIGAHITCTVTNTYITQTLTIDKAVEGGGPLDADDFELFIDDVEVIRGTANLRPAGTYTVTEEGDPRYTPSFGGACDAEGVATLSLGAHITCTVTNTYITQTLTVDKVVEGGGPLDADDFALFVNSTGVTRTVANLLEVGPYTVTEESDPQYTASFGGDCDAEGIATLSLGAHITCTVTNTYITQTLTVDKVVEGGGPLDADDFTLLIDDVEVTRGAANLRPAGTYTVTEESDPRYTASFGSDCDAEGIATLGIGAHITCTVTNTYITQTLTVDKVVVGGGPLDADDFTLLIDDVEVTRGAANLRPAGTYTVTEESDPRYTASFGGACDAEGVATLGIGAHITCTVTNTYITQTLTVDKVVVGDGPLGADDFELFIDGVEVTRGAANLRPAGTYTVTEESDPRYTASFGGACDSEGNVTLSLGAHITCTVTNTYITQTLTVDKVVVGDGPLDADDFELFIDDVEVIRGAANLRPAGTYTVTEEGDPSYTPSFGGACDSEGNVTLSLGAHITCTITNTFATEVPTQTLTVEKIVVGGGALDADDFPLFIDGNGVVRGAPNELDAGTYTVSETSNAFYEASFSGDCDENGVVTLGIGENLTCTITNKERVLFLPGVATKPE